MELPHAFLGSVIKSFIMATNEPYEVLRVKTTYTFNEAIEYMKERDRYPTTKSINWVNAKTGKPVSIGYTR